MTSLLTRRKKQPHQMTTYELRQWQSKQPKRNAGPAPTLRGKPTEQLCELELSLGVRRDLIFKGIDERKVAAMVEKLKSAAWPFPPLQVHVIGGDSRLGGEWYLVDGSHRLAAAERNKSASVPCLVRASNSLAESARAALALHMPLSGDDLVRACAFANKHFPEMPTEDLERLLDCTPELRRHRERVSKLQEIDAEIARLTKCRDEARGRTEADYRILTANAIHARERLIQEDAYLLDIHRLKPDQTGFAYYGVRSEAA